MEALKAIKIIGNQKWWKGCVFISSKYRVTKGFKFHARPQTGAYSCCTLWLFRLLNFKQFYNTVGFRSGLSGRNICFLAISASKKYFGLYTDRPPLVQCRFFFFSFFFNFFFCLLPSHIPGLGNSWRKRSNDRIGNAELTTRGALGPKLATHPAGCPRGPLWSIASKLV